jgi:hypothetical protein
MRHAPLLLVLFVKSVLNPLHLGMMFQHGEQDAVISSLLGVLCARQ